MMSQLEEEKLFILAQANKKGVKLLQGPAGEKCIWLDPRG